ncbi:hypothetical protein SAMN04487770_12612 [Butyrivibrio sp. ob235]|uniref:hypothetical protein n=1 Tax=Butyrivibrio sp. ob235 TaxID=1761780 RepID=UPI0008B8D931|nr:hypothetical protein [Butyrivibrio sp. ob235]SEM10965.1 hypothetical protein SAMN04487770_12612 [Butyrivibrio sp. ob235]
MKRVLKKVTGIIMAAAFAVSALSVAKVDAKATAAINANQEYKLTLGYDEKAEYTFVTQPDCTTSVTACIVGGSSNTGFAWMKLTVDYCKYDSVYVDNEKGAASTGTFVFAPGKTATLTFNSSNVGTAKTIDIAFTVNSTPVSNLEKEGNNSPNSATKIKLNKTYNGVVSYADSDTDWYVFKAPKTGKYKFYVVNALIDGGSSVWCHGYKSKTKNDSDFSAYLTAGDGWKNSKKIKLKKGKKYYIKFSSTGHKAVPVQIRVKKVK